jgi:hypothetical protein
LTTSTSKRSAWPASTASACRSARCSKPSPAEADPS